jgi:hypothetical protein
VEVKEEEKEEEEEEEEEEEIALPHEDGKSRIFKYEHTQTQQLQFFNFVFRL